MARIRAAESLLASLIPVILYLLKFSYLFGIEFLVLDASYVALAKPKPILLLLDFDDLEGDRAKALLAEFLLKKSLDGVFTDDSLETIGKFVS